METESEAVVSSVVETFKQIDSEKDLAASDNQEIETTKEEPKAADITVVDNPVDGCLVSESVVTGADKSLNTIETEAEIDEVPQKVQPASPPDSNLDPVAVEDTEKIETAQQPETDALEKKQQAKKHIVSTVTALTALKATILSPFRLTPLLAKSF